MQLFHAVLRVGGQLAAGPFSFPAMAMGREADNAQRSVLLHCPAGHDAYMDATSTAPGADVSGSRVRPPGPLAGEILTWTSAPETVWSSGPSTTSQNTSFSWMRSMTTASVATL